MVNLSLSEMIPAAQEKTFETTFPTIGQKVFWVVTSMAIFGFFLYASRHKDKFTAYRLGDGRTVNLLKWSSVLCCAWPAIMLLWLIIVLLMNIR